MVGFWDALQGGDGPVEPFRARSCSSEVALAEVALSSAIKPGPQQTEHKPYAGTNGFLLTTPQMLRIRRKGERKTRISWKDEGTKVRSPQTAAERKPPSLPPPGSAHRPEGE